MATSFDDDKLVPQPDEDEAGEIPEFPVFERAEPEPTVDIEPKAEPKKAARDDESALWWGPSQQPPDTEPVRGAWEPPERR